MDHIPTIEYELDNLPGTLDPIDSLVVKGVIILGSAHGHTSLQGFVGGSGVTELGAREAQDSPERAIGLHPRVFAHGEMVKLTQTVVGVRLLEG